MFKSSGLPAQSAVPALLHWNSFSQTALPRGDFPEIVQVTLRTACKSDTCRKPLSEPRFTTWAQHHQLLVYTGQGLKLGNNYALTCTACKVHYFGYFTCSFGKWGCKHAAWLFDDHGMGFPEPVMVNTTTAVSFSYLRELDARMIRNLFQWRSLALEYCDLLCSHGKLLIPIEIS